MYLKHNPVLNKAFFPSPHELFELRWSLCEAGGGGGLADWLLDKVC